MRCHLGDVPVDSLCQTLLELVNKFFDLLPIQKDSFGVISSYFSYLWSQKQQADCRLGCKNLQHPACPARSAHLLESLWLANATSSLCCFTPCGLGTLGLWGKPHDARNACRTSLGQPCRTTGKKILNRSNPCRVLPASNTSAKS